MSILRKSTVALSNLRIDNSWLGVICVVVIFSVPMHFIFTYYTSNEKKYVSLSYGISNSIIKISLVKW